MMHGATWAMLHKLPLSLIMPEQQLDCKQKKGGESVGKLLSHRSMLEVEHDCLPYAGRSTNL